MVPERKMKGTSGASSFASARARTPSKRGIEKSERIACGFFARRARFMSSSTSMRSHETSNPPCSSARSASSMSVSESSTNRTWIGVLSMSLLRCRRSLHGVLPVEGQREEEYRPVADLGLGPDAPAVTVDDALDRRQTDAGPRIVARRVQALERPEELVRISHVEARAVVAYEESRPSLVLQGADLDPRLFLLGGEFPGVSEEVLQDDAQQMRVGVRAHPLPDRNLHRAARIPLLQFAH